jgi:hypothetical protein
MSLRCEDVIQIANAILAHGGQVSGVSIGTFIRPSLPCAPR